MSFPLSEDAHHLTHTGLRAEQDTLAENSQAFVAQKATANITSNNPLWHPLA